MATEPVARSRVVENEEVFDGYALERSCEGEQDEDFRAQTQHLLEQVYEAIELPFATPFLILLWFFSSRAVNSSNEHSCPTHTEACLSSSKSS